MKRLLNLSVALLAMFFIASCQQEKFDLESTGSKVTFSVEIPEAKTKAALSGSEVNQLVYAVYRVTGLNEADAKTSLTDANFLYQSTSVVSDGVSSAELELVNDQDYIVLFWAQNEDKWFKGDGQGEYHFGTEGVTYPTDYVPNSDVYAAFAGVDYIHVDGSKNERIELTRPFAQLNIATKLATNYSINVEGTTVKVEGLATKYNVATGKGEAGEKEFAETAPVKNANNEDVVFSQDYPSYLSMNYIFVPDERANVSVEYTIRTASHGNVNNKVGNVPIAKNYRTNIIGSLLTSKVDYTVELNDEWGDAGKDIEVVTEGLIKNFNNDYEVSTAEGLAYAINKLFVDINGKANSATFFIAPGIYDLSEYAITAPFVKSGTLKIYDIIPVVTRSVTSNGVVITGLESAIISNVSEGATVFFSGITIKNFNGDDDAAALVQNNEGKVILVGCDAVDANGNIDEDATLVGGEGDLEILNKGEENTDGLIYTEEQLAVAFADENVNLITLGADIALEKTLVFPEGRTATLDLRGWELTVAGDETKISSTYVINNLGNLTIKDSYAIGEVNARGIYNGYFNDVVYPNARLLIEGGNFNAKGTNGSAAIFNYGILEIKGGKFTSVGSYSVNSQANGKVTINGGEIAGGMYLSGCEATINSGNISGIRSGCHTVYCYNAKITINGGEFYNYNSGNSTIMASGTTEISFNGGTYGIKDGRVEGNGNTWTSCLLDFSNSAKGTINDGTYNGGIRIQAGTTVDINGGSFNDCVGSNYSIYGTVKVTGGTYTDDTAKKFANKYVHKDYKLVDDNIVAKKYVAKIGENGYESLIEAVDAVQDGETIILIADEKFTENNRTNNNGWWDGISYFGDESFTIDLGGNTISQDGAVNDYLLYFKNNGENENVITLKNGTVNAGTTAYCALATGNGNNSKLTINIENINLIGNKSDGSVVKIRTGSELNVNSGTTITGNNNYLGIENWNAVVNIYDGAEIYMNGTGSYNGCLVGVGGNGTVNVYGGYGKGVSGGLIAMTSGGTINSMGGEWIANTDGTYANSNKSVLIAQSDKQYNAGAGNAVVNVTGGTYKGGYNCYGNAVGDAQINIKGGNFNANPKQYVVEEGYYSIQQETGNYSVIKLNGIAVTPETISGTTFDQNVKYYLLGDFSAISSVNIEPKEGVDAVIDGSYGTFGSIIKFNIPGVPDNASHVSRENGRKGNYTLTNFKNTTLGLGAKGTNVAIMNSTLNCIDVYAANVSLNINGNTINSEYKMHPRVVGGETDYAACLMMMAYDLKFDNNNVMNAIGHIVAINGLVGTFDTDRSEVNNPNWSSNVISYTGNTMSGISGSTKSERAGFKVWDDLTYAPSADYLPQAGQDLINKLISTEWSNTFEPAKNANNPFKLSFYNSNLYPLN